MLLIVPMRVIQRQAASNPVAIIKDDRASRIAELSHLEMRYGFAINSLRLAKQKPGQNSILATKCMKRAARAAVMIPNPGELKIGSPCAFVVAVNDMLDVLGPLKFV